MVRSSLIMNPSSRMESLFRGNKLPDPLFHLKQDQMHHENGAFLLLGYYYVQVRVE